MLTHIDDIISELADVGWVTVDNALDTATLQALRVHAQTDLTAGKFHAAGVGHGEAFNVNQTIRRDHVAWLEPSTEGALATYQHLIERLRLSINQQLFLGVFDFESHFAHYAKGAFYRTHVDNFRNKSDRLVTAILYLNENWHTDDGGQLRLYTDGTATGEFVDILPQAGTLVLFLSAQFWHEVLPANRQRFSLTGWLRKRSEG